MVRDKVGSFKERADMERYLSDWIMGYVLANPENAGETLAGAEAARRRRSEGGGDRGQPRLLLGEVPSAAALPARGRERLA